MARIGQKVALKNLLAAAEALNGKFTVDEGDLPLVKEFQKAALDAKEALRESFERLVKRLAKRDEKKAEAEGDEVPGSGS